MMGTPSSRAHCISHLAPSALAVFLLSRAITPSHPLITLRHRVFHFSSKGSFIDTSVKEKGVLSFFPWPNFLGPAVEKVRVSELAEDTFRDYRVNGHKSLQFVEWRWKKHIEPMFGPIRAVDVTTETVTKYIVNRKTEGAENATINREFAALKRMFRIGYRSTPRKVYQVPVFPRLRENAPRNGFIEEKQYRQLCKQCSELWLRAMLALGYSFGFRKGELQSMRARQVDLLNRLLMLDPGTTKNSEGRSVKLTSETLELVEQCMFSKTPDDYLLTRRDGHPIKDFRATWDKLRQLGGLGQAGVWAYFRHS
jgi:integrase